MAASPVPALVGANLAALTFAALLLRFALAEPEYPVTAAPDASVQAPALSAERPPVSMEALLEAPLFVASRRPKPAAPESGAEALPAAPRLVGIIDEGSRRLALVESGTGDQRKLVRPGEVFEHWRIRAIGPKTIDLRYPSDAEGEAPHTPLTLQLRSPEAAPTTPGNE